MTTTTKTPINIAAISIAALLAILTLAATRPDAAPVGRYQMHPIPGSGLPLVIDTTTGQTWLLTASATNAYWAQFPAIGRSEPLRKNNLTK